MAQSLLISVHFHEGRYYGQDDGFDGLHGWPPSPGRLFQALVAGAACGARFRAEDEKALRWLERLDPPRIAAPAARRGQRVNLFVPNNDLDSKGGDPARVSEIRDGKQWQPCFFDVEQPILYVWEFESGEAEAEQISAIAAKLYQLGRGIDMAWATGQVLDQCEAEAHLASHPGPVRTHSDGGDTASPHTGTLDSLIQRHQERRQRLSTEGAGRKTRQLFTQPSKASFAYIGYDTPKRYLHFELRNAKGSFSPQPLASVAPLVTSLRDAATLRLQESLPEQAKLYERLIIGRGAGPRDLPQRVRLVPISSIGTKHTDPSIRRILVEIPAASPLRVDDLKWAFTGLNPHDPQTGEVWPGYLTSTEDSQMADRFMQPARLFRSITPVALPNTQRRRIGVADKKAADERNQEEWRAAGAVLQALRHAGLKKTQPLDIRVQREPFQRRGVRAEYFAEGSRFSKHALWHVEIQFREPIAGPLVIGDLPSGGPRSTFTEREPIAGPLVIGDGRFCGLGLLEPVVRHNDVFGFNLAGKPRVVDEDRTALVRALRRALMSLARDKTGGVNLLFSGHGPDGQADRSGHHDHVFLAADCSDDQSITRLVVAAPWAVDRRAKPQRNGRREFDRVTRKLTELVAGRLGRFQGLSADAINDSDPLIGPADTWINKTPYIATRNLKKRDDPVEIVKADVCAECHRRGLPTPTTIEVLDVSSGPRGGCPTAKLKLCFARAIRGPILLGRDSHMGGGLFFAK